MVVSLDYQELLRLYLRDRSYRHDGAFIYVRGFLDKIQA